MAQKKAKVGKKEVEVDEDEGNLDDAGHKTPDIRKNKPAVKPSVAFNWELYRVHLEGTTPLLQARMTNSMLEPSGADGADTKIVKRKHMLPRDVAEESAYRDNKGLIVHPASAVTRMLHSAGRNHRDKATKRGLNWLIAPGVRMVDAFIPICDAEGKRLDDFEVDSRTAVNHNCRPPARILVHRARYDSWSSGFQVRVNTGVIEPAMVQQLFVEGGVLVGIGAFRPEKQGEFGTFAVTLWEKVPDSAVATRKRALVSVNGG